MNTFPAPPDDLSTRERSPWSRFLWLVVAGWSSGCFAAYVVHGGTSWHYFQQGQQALTDLDDHVSGGLHLYAALPFLQIGPVTFVAGLLTAPFGPRGLLVAQLFGMAAGAAILWLVRDLTARARPDLDPADLDRRTLLAAIFFIPVWAYLSPLVRIPAGFSKVMGTGVEWLFDTTPQRHLNDRTMFLPQGKVIGGSTSINAMLYVRGNRADYDGWRDAGNPGWGYDDLLPLFTLQENNERLNDEYHGVGGPLNVADQVQTNPMSKAFVRAAQEAGIPYTADPNGARQEGVFFHQVTQRRARRESAATAFLRPVRNRPNLTVRTRAIATRVLVRDGRAVGLEYLHRGRPRTAHADGEVIVSAGAINSPRLLLSGIGPADELQALGIDVVADVPGVGKNLHDRLEVYVTAECAEPISYSGEDRWHRAAVHAVQYGPFRTDPATATITEAGAFLHSRGGLDSPDLQLHMLPAYVVWEDYARTAQRMPGHGITLLACNVRPRSRGSVTLASADPAALPKVDPNYLDDPEDWKVAIDGFRWIRKVLAAPAFAPYLKQEQLPGAEVQTDEQIRDYIRRYGKTDYHPVGSCKMGTDELAVVDERLRVRGLDQLRVIDSSILPAIISGNTQAPSMVIGEKGAAMVLSDRAATTSVVSQRP